MTRILIGGYYGAGNLGDEAILECMLSGMKSIDNEIQFVVTSWNPEDTKNRFNVQTVHWKDWASIIDASQRSDLIIVGGGGLFQDYWGVEPNTYLRASAWDISAYGGLPLLAKLNNIPSMIYSVGIGPLTNPVARYHTRIAIENSRIATLRDHDSLKLLQDCGIDLNHFAQNTLEILADPVFSLATTNEDEKVIDEYFTRNHLDPSSDYLAINLRYWEFSGPPEDWLRNIRNGVKKFLAGRENFKILLIPFQINPENSNINDTVILDEFSQLLNEPDRVFQLKEPHSPHFIQALLKRCKLILGMRLHSLIMGINVNTPVIGLPYDPKILSQLTEASLADCCGSSLTLNSDELFELLEKGINERESIQRKMRDYHKKATKQAQKNAVLAVKLARTTKRTPGDFLQNFSLDQAKLILELDKQIENRKEETQSLCNSIERYEKFTEAQNIRLNDQLKSINNLKDQLDNLQQIKSELSTQCRTYQAQLEIEISKNIEQAKEITNAKEQLNAIYNGKSWKLISLYYRAVEKFPLRFFYQFISKKQSPEFHRESSHDSKKELDGKRILTKVIQHLNSRELKGIFIITSGFQYDRHCNQRVIHLSRFLGRQGFGVIFVGWRWSKNDAMQNTGKEVEKNVFQIPVDIFLENSQCLEQLDKTSKNFVIEFPHPDFFPVALQLKNYGYKLIFDIIDEWEEFSKVGQAPWYKKDYEQALILNSDYIFAVSKPLVEKFKNIRPDIEIIPNGFDPEQIGRNHQDISLQKSWSEEIHIGYFGHLTESWFDWSLLFDVIDLSLQKGLKVKFHIIGYGEPDLTMRMKSTPDLLIFHGKVAPKDLFRYAQDWDMAMTPFKPGNLAEAADPLKVYEYSYFGLPVIVTGINHLQEFPNVEVVKTAEEFCMAIKTFEKKRKQDHQARGNYFQHILAPRKKEGSMMISGSTWRDRFTRFIEILNNETWIF